MKAKVTLVFSTTHETLKAEEILKNAKIPNMITPKPEGAESKCGMAIKIYEEDLKRAGEMLKRKKAAKFAVLKPA